MKTELQHHSKAVRVTCNDGCALDVRSDDNGKFPHPSQVARTHVSDTGHHVEITRTKRATYGPKYPTTKEVQSA